MGRISDGINTLKILLERRELPDMYDINVALSAMAEYSPRKASRMIGKMVRRGLTPDAVTFGTVLHHSIIHGDMDLANKLFNQAQQTGTGEVFSWRYEGIDHDSGSTFGAVGSC